MLDMKNLMNMGDVDAGGEEGECSAAASTTHTNKESLRFNTSITCSPKIQDTRHKTQDTRHKRQKPKPKTGLTNQGARGGGGGGVIFSFWVRLKSS